MTLPRSLGTRSCVVILWVCAPSTCFCMFSDFGPHTPEVVLPWHGISLVVRVAVSSAVSCSPAPYSGQVVSNPASVSGNMKLLDTATAAQLLL